MPAGTNRSISSEMSSPQIFAPGLPLLQNPGKSAFAAPDVQHLFIGQVAEEL